MREGFTSMIRAIPIVKGKEIIYYTSETYINEPDSLQTLKILDKNLNTIISTKILLPYKNDLYHKYSKEVFQKITINTIDRIILCGRNDSVYELSSELRLNFLFTDQNIKEGSKVKQMDLDGDGELETIFFSSAGLTIFSNGLEDKFFVESPGGGITYNTAFDKNGRMEQKQGFYLKTEDKKLVFLSYTLNPFYKLKIVFCILSVIVFYLLISFIITINRVNN